MGKALKHAEKIRVISSYILVILLFMSSLNFTFNFIIHSEAKNNETDLSYTICFEKPLLSEVTINNKTFTQISMPNCLSHAMPGDPALPIHPVKILLPQGKIVTDIRVSWCDIVKVEGDLSDKPVVPQQTPLSTGSNRGNVSFVMNRDIYRSENPVFRKVYCNGGVGFCRGFAILTVYLFPVRYIPRTGRLYYFPSMEIVVDLDDDRQMVLDESGYLLRSNSYDLDVVGSMVVNMEETGGTYSQSSYGTLNGDGLCDPSDTYEYVIITNAALNSTVGQSYNWSDLLDHRESYNGLNTTKVAVETICNCSAYWNDTALFNDSAALVREFIKDAYMNWDTRYVVLGGDWDIDDVDKQIVPARIFTDYNSVQDPYTTYDDMPCDMYYSHLDGNWRNTTHNYWGGGKNSGVNDHYAELYVGRLTVSNAEDVSNIVKKIMWYDLSADDDFISKAVFFGGDLGSQFDVTSADYMEEIRSGDDPHFYQCRGFVEWNDNSSGYEFNISTRVYYDWGATIPDDYQTVIDNDNACLINHLSHGNPTTALDMTNAQLAALTNSKCFFAYSQQCLSGRFTEGDTTEKTLMCNNWSNGAFGLVWNTGYGWGSSSNTNAPSQYLQRHFWDYMFNGSMDNWQMGVAHAYSKDEMSPYVDIPEWHYAWCYNWYSTHFFGDPAQKIRVGPSDENIVLNDENPADGATSVSVGDVTLQINVSDPEGDTMNITFRTNASGSWQDIGSNNSQLNGTYSQIYSFNNSNTIYWWSVNVTDISGSSGWTNATYNFTTVTNSPPILTNETPTNQSTSVSLDTSTLIVTIKDPEGNIFNWTIETSPNIGNNQGNNETNGSKTCSISSLDYSTTYYWFINTTDNESGNWTNATYCFTTRSLYVPLPPSSLNATAYNRTRINISWINIGNNKTYIEWNNTASWNRSEGNFLYNDTGTSYQHTDLGFNTQCFYQAWSWNDTDACYSTSYAQINTTTHANQAPALSGESPTNGSTNIDLNRSAVNVTIEDLEGDSINWTIEGSYVTANSSTGDGNGSKSANLNTPLPYNTNILWYVNVTDGYNWSNATYCFTTEPNNPPALSNPTPANQSTGVSIGTSTLTIAIEDENGDNFNWTIETNPNIGNNQGNNETNGSKTCSISGLNYYTTYYWYVNVTDNTTGISVNKTYWFKTEQQSSSPGPTYSPGPTQSPNKPPDKPSTPDGPTTGYVNIIYNYSTTTTDPDKDKIRYRFNWGDGTLSEWTDFVNSDTEITSSHSWDSNGTYNIEAIAQDKNGKNSSWSNILTTTINKQTETKEEKRETTIETPENATVEQTIVFNIAENPVSEEENASYIWDFGDGTTGYGINPSHVYSSPGTYIVTLTIYDSNGEVVDINSFEVTVNAKSDVTPLDVTNEETSNQTALFLQLIMIVSATVFALLLFLFWRNIKSVFTASRKENRVDSWSIRGVKTQIRRTQGYDIRPVKKPFEDVKVYYDHDIIQPAFNGKPEHDPIKPIDEFNMEKKHRDIEEIKRFIDKLNLSKKDKTDENKEK